MTSTTHKDKFGRQVTDFDNQYRVKFGRFLFFKRFKGYVKRNGKWVYLNSDIPEVGLCGFLRGLELMEYMRKMGLVMILLFAVIGVRGQTRTQKSYIDTGLYFTGGTATAFPNSGTVWSGLANNNNDSKVRTPFFIEFNSAPMPLLTITRPEYDANGDYNTYTVTFAKSKVHFINDSTFTFRVKK